MILLLSDDLLDASKTIASGRAEGIAVLQCKTLAALSQQLATQNISCCVIDIQLPGLDIDELMATIVRQATPPRVVAYGSHVDTARLSVARKAGCDEVMPRSKYFAEMPMRIQEWAR